MAVDEEGTGGGDLVVDPESGELVTRDELLMREAVRKKQRDDALMASPLARITPGTTQVQEQPSEIFRQTITPAAQPSPYVYEEPPRDYEGESFFTPAPPEEAIQDIEEEPFYQPDDEPPARADLGMEPFTPAPPDDVLAPPPESPTPAPPENFLLDAEAEQRTPAPDRAMQQDLRDAEREAERAREQEAAQARLEATDLAFFADTGLSDEERRRRGQFVGQIPPQGVPPEQAPTFDELIGGPMMTTPGAEPTGVLERLAALPPIEDFGQFTGAIPYQIAQQTGQALIRARDEEAVTPEQVRAEILKVQPDAPPEAVDAYLASADGAALIEKIRADQETVRGLSRTALDDMDKGLARFEAAETARVQLEAMQREPLKLPIETVDDPALPYPITGRLVGNEFVPAEQVMYYDRAGYERAVQAKFPGARLADYRLGDIEGEGESLGGFLSPIQSAIKTLAAPVGAVLGSRPMDAPQWVWDHVGTTAVDKALDALGWADDRRKEAMVKAIEAGIVLPSLSSFNFTTGTIEGAKAGREQGELRDQLKHLPESEKDEIARSITSVVLMGRADEMAADIADGMKVKDVAQKYQNFFAELGGSLVLDPLNFIVPAANVVKLQVGLEAATGLLNLERLIPARGIAAATTPVADAAYVPPWEQITRLGQVFSTKGGAHLVNPLGTAGADARGSTARTFADSVTDFLMHTVHPEQPGSITELPTILRTLAGSDASVAANQLFPGMGGPIRLVHDTKAIAPELVAALDTPTSNLAKALAAPVWDKGDTAWDALKLAERPKGTFKNEEERLRAVLDATKDTVTRVARGKLGLDPDTDSALVRSQNLYRGILSNVYLFNPRYYIRNAAGDMVSSFERGLSAWARPKDIGDYFLKEGIVNRGTGRTTGQGELASLDSASWNPLRGLKTKLSGTENARHDTVFYYQHQKSMDALKRGAADDALSRLRVLTDDRPGIARPLWSAIHDARSGAELDALRATGGSIRGAKLNASFVLGDLDSADLPPTLRQLFNTTARRAQGMNEADRTAMMKGVVSLWLDDTARRASEAGAHLNDVKVTPDELRDLRDSYQVLRNQGLPHGQAQAKVLADYGETINKRITRSQMEREITERSASDRKFAAEWAKLTKQQKAEDSAWWTKRHADNPFKSGEHPRGSPQFRTAMDSWEAWKDRSRVELNDKWHKETAALLVKFRTAQTGAGMGGTKVARSFKSVDEMIAALEKEIERLRSFTGEGPVAAAIPARAPGTVLRAPEGAVEPAVRFVTSAAPVGGGSRPAAIQTVERLLVRAGAGDQSAPLARELVNSGIDLSDPRAVRALLQGRMQPQGIAELGRAAETRFPRFPPIAPEPLPAGQIRPQLRLRDVGMEAITDARIRSLDLDEANPLVIQARQHIVGNELRVPPGPQQKLQAATYRRVVREIGADVGAPRRLPDGTLVFPLTARQLPAAPQPGGFVPRVGQPVRGGIPRPTSPLDAIPRRPPGNFEADAVINRARRRAGPATPENPWDTLRDREEALRNLKGSGAIADLSGEAHATAAQVNAVGSAKDALAILHFDDRLPQAVADFNRERGAFTNLTREQANAWNAILDERKGRLLTERLVADAEAKAMSEWVLHNYNRIYDYDFWLRWVSPWELWTSRTMAKLPLRMADHPGYFSKYEILREQIAGINKDKPEYMQQKATIPVPFLPNWMADRLLFDPVKAVLPTDLTDSYIRQSEEDTNVGRARALAGFVSFSPGPVADTLLSMVPKRYGGGGMPWWETQARSPIADLYSIATSALAIAGVKAPIRPILTGQEVKETRRQLALMVVNGEMTSEEYEQANKDFEQNHQTGFALRGQPLDNKHAWTAVQRAQGRTSARSFASYLALLSPQFETNDEQRMYDLSKQYGDIKDTEGKDAAKKFIDEHPELPLWWNIGDTPQERMNAQATTLYFEQRARIKGEYEQALEKLPLLGTDRDRQLERDKRDAAYKKAEAELKSEYPGFTPPPFPADSLAQHLANSIYDMKVPRDTNGVADWDAFFETRENAINALVRPGVDPGEGTVVPGYQPVSRGELDAALAPKTVDTAAQQVVEAAIRKGYEDKKGAGADAKFREEKQRAEAAFEKNWTLPDKETLADEIQAKYPNLKATREEILRSLDTSLPKTMQQASSLSEADKLDRFRANLDGKGVSSEPFYANKKVGAIVRTQEDLDRYLKAERDAEEFTSRKAANDPTYRLYDTAERAWLFGGPAAVPLLRLEQALYDQALGPLQPSGVRDGTKQKGFNSNVTLPDGRKMTVDAALKEVNAKQEMMYALQHQGEKQLPSEKKDEAKAQTAGSNTTARSGAAGAGTARARTTTSGTRSGTGSTRAPADAGPRAPAVNWINDAALSKRELVKPETNLREEYRKGLGMTPEKFEKLVNAYPDVQAAFGRIEAVHRGIFAEGADQNAVTAAVQEEALRVQEVLAKAKATEAERRAGPIAPRVSHINDAWLQAKRIRAGEADLERGFRLGTQGLSDPGKWAEFTANHPELRAALDALTERTAALKTDDDAPDDAAALDGLYTAVSGVSDLISAALTADREQKDELRTAGLKLREEQKAVARERLAGPPKPNAPNINEAWLDPKRLRAGVTDFDRAYRLGSGMGQQEWGRFLQANPDVKGQIQALQAQARGVKDTKSDVPMDMEQLQAIFEAAQEVGVSISEAKNKAKEEKAERSRVSYAYDTDEEDARLPVHLLPARKNAKKKRTRRRAA